MKIAIHHKPTANKDSFSWRWMSLLKKRGIKANIIDFRSLSALTKIRQCDAAMWHWFHLPDDKITAPRILNSIEMGLKKPVFPNLSTRWHYDDKISQYYLLQSLGVPVVKTWVFWERESAESFLHKCKYPLVFKLSVGAGSANVIRLDSRDHALALMRRQFESGIHPYAVDQLNVAEPIDILLGWRERLQSIMKGKIVYLPKDPYSHWYYILQKNYLYLQEFLKNNPYDIRVTVIGNRAFGFVRYNRDNDFRASGSGKIDYDVGKIPLEAVKQAFFISKQCGFQSMAYDFLIDNSGKVVVNEISYAYVNKAVYDCPGHWDSDLNYIPGHMWPEEAHIEDFLDYIKQRA